MMRLFLTTLLILSCLLLQAGCEDVLLSLRGNQGKSADSPAESDSGSAAQPTATQTSRPDYQGHHLQVSIDGRPTALLRQREGEQLWNGGTCSAQPTVAFQINDTLGRVRSVTLLLKPTWNGKVIDHSNFYQYSGQEPLTEGNAIRLDRFDHYHDGTLDAGLTSLPAGTYRLYLQVDTTRDGRRHWDRQVVVLEVQ